MVELMAALAVASIVMVGIYTMYFTQTKSHVTQQAVVDMQQGIRLALFLMEKEIRMAGYDTVGTSGAGITEAGRAFITFSMDITGGETDGKDNDDGLVDGDDLKLDTDGVDNDGDSLIDEDDEGDETTYGDGDSNVLNNDFPSGTEDSPHENTANDMSYVAIPYWFKVTHLPNDTQTQALEGSSKSYKRHYYRVDSNANRSQDVEVMLSKIFKIGYN